jgi:nucleotide-binding universal stress UspA family protein
MSQDELPSLEGILIATDGSLPSHTAAKAAVQIADTQNQKVIGLYIVGERKIMLDDSAYKTELSLDTKPVARSDLVKQFKNQGDIALDWLTSLCASSNVSVTTDIIFGGIPEMVLEKAKLVKIIALGRRGHSHRTISYELGGNFRDIASHAHLPLLIGGEEETNFRRLLIILDTHAATKDILSWVSALQKAFSSEVFVTIYKMKEMQPERIYKILSQLNRTGLVECHQISKPINSGSDIVTTAVDNHVDTIIMPGYRHTFLGIWLEKNPLESVLRNTELLVVAV